jgi:uncharacterized phage-associated protein
LIRGVRVASAGERWWLAMYDAMTIAKWFVAWAESDDADRSNLKIQKLLYYAQGHHLAEYGSRLFGDKIYAWSHGPVVPSVWREFRDFGSADVDLSSDDDFDWDQVDEDTTSLLIEVWETYGAFGAWRLRNMTHNERPWAECFEDGVRNIEIPPELIEEYFEERLASR